MSKVLINSVKEVARLLKLSVCNNVSFHPQSDFVEIASDRDYKFPAIIMRGPRINEDLIFRTEGGSVVKDLNTGAYVKTPMPVVSDVYFDLLLLTEGDMEGLEAVSNIITFFATNKQIEVAENDYPVKAHGTINVVTNVQPNDTVTVGNVTYKFVTVVTVANDVKIGNNINASALNLKKAINLETKTDEYGAGTIVNQLVSASVLNGVITITAINSGVAGNALTLVANGGSRLTKSGNTLTSGVDGSPIKIYNVVLMDPIAESAVANISDITRYEGKFCIEGIEFSSGDNTIGKIAIEVNPNVNQI